MNIWILEGDSGVSLLYYSTTVLPTDEILISGFLAALNQFALSELKQQIESIDIGGLKWIYILDSQSNILFIMADSKDINSEILRSRMNVLRAEFVKEYILTGKFVSGKWDGGLDLFRPFQKIIENYYSQWIIVEKSVSFAENFDFIGVFQQIFILLHNTIKKSIQDKEKDEFLKKMENLFFYFKTRPDVSEDSELAKINYSKDSGFNILNINPLNSDAANMRKQITYLVKLIMELLTKKIGLKERLIYLSQENIFGYILNNIHLLKNLDLDIFLFQLFLLD